VFLVPAGPSYPLSPLPLTKLWFGYAFPVPRLFEFLIGMLLARIVIAGRWPRIGLPWVITLVVAGYAGAVLLPAPFGFSLATVVPICAVIGTAATADVNGARTVLNSRLAIWLGTASFGFYMIQSIPIFFGRLVVFGGNTYNDVVATVLLVLLFGTTLFLGWLLYLLVEAPIVRRWSHRRTAVGRDRQPERSAPILS
jgi:peptidoglycan/LPS O-acetylase OafA/YrhL